MRSAGWGISTLLAAVLVLAAPAGADPGCEIVRVSEGPVALAAGDGAEPDEPWEASVLLSSSCAPGSLRAATTADGVEVAPDGLASPTPLVELTLTAEPPPDGEPITGQLVVTSDEGALLVVPIGASAASAPEVEILDDSLTARFQGGATAEQVHVAIRVTEGELPLDGLGAQVFLTEGGIATATEVQVAPPSTGPTGTGTSTSTTEPAPATSSIGPKEARGLTLTFAPDELTGGGGTLVLTSTTDGTTIGLASAELTIARQLSDWSAVLLMALPLLAAIATASLAAFLVVRDRPKAVEEARQALESATDADRKAREATLARAEADLADPAGRLPKRATWSFADGWAGSLTAFGATVAAVLAATGLLEEFLPGLSTGPFIAANLFFVALVGAAPMAYNAFGRFEHGKQVGTYGGLYVAITASLWGVYGFLCLLARLVWDLENALARGFFLVMLAAATIGIAIYAVRTVRGRAQPPKPEEKAPTTPYTVQLPMDEIAKKVAEQLQRADQGSELAGTFGLMAQRLDAGDVHLEPIEVAVPDATVAPLLSAESLRRAARRDTWGVL